MQTPLKEPVRFVTKHRVAIISIAIVLFLILFLGGAKIYLFAKFLLGSDLVVSLSTPSTYIIAEQGIATDISFKTSITANPFCKPTCNSILEDVSKGNILEQTSFNMQPGLPVTKDFSITSPSQGTGYALYRYTIACKTDSNALCHTAGQVTTRSAIVVLNYTLSEENQLKKENQKKFIEEMSDNTEYLFSLYETAKLNINNTKGKIINEETITNNSIELFSQELNLIRNQWKQEEYNKIDSKIKILTDEFYILNQTIYGVHNEIIIKINAYNTALQTMSNISNNLLDLSNQQPNQNFSTNIEQLINRLNALNKSLESPIDAIILSNYANTLNADVQNYEARQVTEFETIRKNVSQTHVQLCISTGICNTFQEINSSWECILINNSLNKLIVINQSIEDNDTNYVEPLIATHIKQCTETNVSVSSISAKQITITQTDFTKNTTTLQNPAPMCCIKGHCIPCCFGNSCEDQAYPILLIHGHAFNKDLSAEYSLEAFNKLQQKLEDDGFVSAGAVTLYTQHDIPYGTWGAFNVPFTIRASYYFDLFKEPENYVVVQTNSENIDTYAIRLRDLIETTQYKTGKSKVDVITFSMGGLVARRYIQLFGDSAINKLILIAAPNHGVSGDVAQYCSFIGASLECRDLKKDSLLINKLTTGVQPKINITNIVGTGCQMSDGTGDGVVLESSALLENGNNIIIKGTCRSSALPLHTDLLDVDRYPAIYDAVKNALNITE